MDNIPSDSMPADRLLLEKAEKDRVFVLFRNDEHETSILHGVIGGLRKSEIKLKYGLDEKNYAGAMRRLRVKLMAAQERGNNNGK